MANFLKGFTYIVGFDNPALISNGRIREEAEAQGFSVVTLMECDAFSGLPFATPTKCGDGWDYIAVVRRTGADRWIDLHSRIAWVVTLPPPQLPPAKPAVPGQEPPPPQPTEPTMIARKENIGKVDRRRQIHMVTEAGGLLVALPLGLWSSTKIKNKSARYALRGMLGAMAVVDAWLLSTYLRE